MAGTSVAAELMMTGRFIHAERALATGLVSEVVDDDQLESAARSLIADLLAASPMGLRKTKEVMTRASEIEDLSAVMALEERTQMACLQAGSLATALSALDGTKRDDA
jgi:enoyl-CoA hydratase/carnithine racemase